MRIALYILLLILFSNQLFAQCDKEVISFPTILKQQDDKALVIETKAVKEFKLLVFDHWGQELYTQQIKVNNSSARSFTKSNTNWPTAQFKAGLYILSVEAICNDNQKTRRGGNLTLTK